jgi:hypothetical protein
MKLTTITHVSVDGVMQGLGGSSLPDTFLDDAWSEKTHITGILLQELKTKREEPSCDRSMEG